MRYNYVSHKVLWKNTINYNISESLLSVVGASLSAQCFWETKTRIKGLVTFGLKYLQDCGWEPPKQGYAVVMFLPSGPCTFYQFFSILWRKEMISHPTCRKIHGNSSRTSGTLILTLRRKQTKQCSYFCNFFFLSSLWHLWKEWGGVRQNV